jgi:hypothetical protein
MRTKVSSGSPAPASCCALASVHAGMTCGRSVVLPGATQAERCSTSAARPRRRQSLGGKEFRQRVRPAGGAPDGREVWVYDLSSRQLVRYSGDASEQGRLRAIDFGGYGQ